jgi:hypothetical protein
VADRQDDAPTLSEVVVYLNAVQLRATYAAVAEVTGGVARGIGSRLTRLYARSPEGSWVVNGESGLPSGYSEDQRHPALLRTTEIIASGDELRRRLAEWNAAGRPGRPKSGGVTEQPAPPRPAQPQVSSMSVDELAALGRRLTAMLNALEPRPGGPSEGIRNRIERLSRDGGPIPRHIAALMVTITEMRNTAEHEATVLSASECAVVRNAWQAIQDWARWRQGKTS